MSPLLILASRSPRRRELLAEAGYRFVVIEPDPAAEEMNQAGWSPEALVAELARRKAADVVRRIEAGEIEDECLEPDSRDCRSGGRASNDIRIVIGCDTVAECDGRILGKPADEADARRMLLALSGRTHRVLSGLCVWPLPPTRAGDRLSRAAANPDTPEPDTQVDVTLLRMDELSEEQLGDYLAGGAWRGKAGAFGYQDQTGWVHVLQGSPTNVVGLPMERLARMLERVSHDS